MLTGIMLLGGFVGICGLYISYTEYRRKSLTIFDFCLWLLLWIVLILVSLYPTLFSIFNKSFFNVNRPLDLIIILSCLILFFICFFLNLSCSESYKKICILEKNIKNGKIK